MQYCNKTWCINGAAALLGTIALLGLGVFLFITGAMAFDAGRAGGPLLAPGVVCLFLGCLAPTSLTIVQPGQTKVVQFFGNYVGTIRKAGLLMTVPFSSKKNVSVRVNNFETNELKANDIETRISALAYAPEIAQAMLQRQQASAVIAAREKGEDRRGRGEHGGDRPHPAGDRERGQPGRRTQGGHGQQSVGCAVR